MVTIPVLHCTAWQDIKAKPTRSLSYNGAFHQLWGRPGTNHSPRYTALLAVFTVLRSSRYLEFAALSEGHGHGGVSAAVTTMRPGGS